MKIKVSEASGEVLDWMVAKCEGVTVLPKRRGGHFVTLNKGETVLLCYSTDWAQGGPIIEREIFKLFRNVGGAFTAQIRRRVPYYSPTYGTDIGADEVISHAGTTPLIAAMRCFVCSKLGDEVEVPNRLIGEAW